MEVTLNRNGWHRKLQEFVFRNPPTFNNLCPYFWLTIFCFIFTFIFPIVPLIRSIGWTGRSFFRGMEKFADWWDRIVCDRMWRNAALIMKDEEIIKSWTIDLYYNGYGDADWESYNFWKNEVFRDDIENMRRSHQSAQMKKFELWKEETPDWEIKLAEIKEKRRLFFEEQVKEKARLRAEYVKIVQEENKKKERRKRRQQQMYTSIVKYTKWLAYVLLVAVAVVVGFLLYKGGLVTWKGIQWAVAHFSYTKFIMIMKVTGFFAAGIVAVIILRFFIKKISCNVSWCIDWEKTSKNWYAWPFVKFAQMLLWCGKALLACIVGVGVGLKFFGSFVMATKKDYCPGINWVENDTTE